MGESYAPKIVNWSRSFRRAVASVAVRSSVRRITLEVSVMRTSVRTVCTTVAVFGLLGAGPAQGQWPIKEFEVVNVEPSGSIERNSYLQNWTELLVRLIRETSIIDPDFPEYFHSVPLDSATKATMESFLSSAAVELERWGFPPPGLEPVVTLDSGAEAYRVYLVNELDGPRGKYIPSCGRDDETVIVLSASDILTGPTEIPFAPRGAVTLAHELFHAVQWATPFFGCGDGGVGDWITEGQAEAIGYDLVREIGGLNLLWTGSRQWGPADYAAALPKPNLTDKDLEAYYTSSLWRYFAESYASRAAGGRAPGPEINPVDYRYLAEWLRTGPVARDCGTAHAECDAEVRWLDQRLESTFGEGLRDVFPHFMEALALYGDHRPARSRNSPPLTGSQWRDRVFGPGCEPMLLSANPSDASDRSDAHVDEGPVGPFDELSAQCWAVQVDGFEQDVSVAITVDATTDQAAIADLTAAVAGPPMWAEKAREEVDPQTNLRRATWVFDFPKDTTSYFLLTNIADEPVSTMRNDDLSIMFEVLEPKAVVSFSSSVSGQDPFDFDLGPPGSGVYEVPSDRLKFAVQYINADGNACVGGLNLPSADGDAQDLVTIWGGFPLPLTEGDFPIEPPTYTESDFPAPAPVTDGIRPGVLGGQVWFSCEHGGCGEEPWGAPVRPINAFRGTFRISKISRMQVIGSLDMLAVDEPVRVSATFVAPLGGPRGLSPSHPCAPVEPDGIGSGQVSSSGGGSGAGPQPGDPSTDPNEGDPPTGPDSNTGPGAEADSQPDARTEPDAGQPSDGPADPGRDPSDPRSDAREVRTEPLVETQRMGTIEATVDGERRTWYVVEALTNTGRYASGRWDAEGAGNMTLVLEGFDTQALPLDGFATGPTGASTYGSYRGSVITITVPVAGDGGSIRMDLAEDESGGTVTYVQDAGSEAAGSYTTVEGSIQGDWAASDDGSIRLEGRFEGLLRAGGGSQPIQIENGTLTVEGIPPGMLLRR